MDPADVEAKITPRTTRSDPQFAYVSGAPADIAAIQKVTQSHKLFLLEDCAQCAGGSIGGRKVGTFGDMAIFSFQMNKNMTSGEGGCLVTNDARLYNRAVACHDTGYARDSDGRALFDNLDLCLWGRGYRMDEIRASILRVQLKKSTGGRPAYAPQQIPDIRQASRTISWRFVLRRVIDPDGDTGSFLLATFQTLGTRATGSIAPYVPRGSSRWPQRRQQHRHDRVGTSHLLEHSQPGA